MNHLQLTAAIARSYPLRYTPAGLPALDMILEHQSEVEQLGHARRLALELRATAFGPQAEALAAQPLGVTLEFTGFLSNSRNGKGVVLQVQDYTPV